MKGPEDMAQLPLLRDVDASAFSVTQHARTSGLAKGAMTSESAKKRRILYVEDDPALRMSTSDMLDDMGHQVTEAPDAPAALEWLREGHPVDLLLTDMQMPLMNGRELAAAARVLRPGLPVVYTTGSSDKNAGDGASHGRTEYLFKPFGLKELEALFQTLD